MCNLYAMMRTRAEAAALARAMTDRNNNQPPLPGVYPGYDAPVVVRTADGAREMRDLQWGLPTHSNVLYEATDKRAQKLREKGKSFDFKELLSLEPDSGTTNVRNTKLPHWTQWLGPENRCLVPMTSFCEPDQVSGSKENIWFAFSEDRPLAFFAGVWVPDWERVRLIRDGRVKRDLFGFLTTTPNVEVATYHKKAMPVILTKPEEWDLWLSNAPWSEASHLQRPLPDGALKIVNRGVKQDDVEGRTVCGASEIFGAWTHPNP